MMTIPTIDPTVKLKHILENALPLQPNFTLEMAIKQNVLTSIDEVLANHDAAMTEAVVFTQVNMKLNQQQHGFF